MEEKEKEEIVYSSNKNTGISVPVANQIDTNKELLKLAAAYNETISLVATEYVRDIGANLLHWKGIECNVIFDPTLTKWAYYSGGPVVTAIISFGPNKDHSHMMWKRHLYDVAKNIQKFWNPVENPSSFKLVRSKGERIKTKKGELEILVPMKYCSVSKTHSITVKGPDGVSITVSDDSGLRLESEMLLEARVKLSRLIHWDNEEKD